MDPLGAEPIVYDATQFEHWVDTEVPEYDFVVEDPENKRKSPFPWRDELNRKLVLW